MSFNFSTRFSTTAIVAALTLVLYCLPGHAQSIRLRPFQENETRTFTSSRIKSAYSGKTLDSEAQVIFDVTLKVRSSSPEGSTIEWTYTKVKNEFKYFQQPQKEHTVATVVEYLGQNLYDFKSLTVVYKTDSSGAFKSMVNKDEVKAYIKSVLTKVAEEKKADAKFTTALLQFSSAFMSDQYIGYAFIQDIHFYHQLNGTDLKLQQKVYEIALPNPLSGDPLPGTLTTHGKANDDKSYSYVMLQQVDKEKMSKVVADKLKDTYDKMGEPKDTIPALDFEMIYSYTIDGEKIKGGSLKKTVSSGGYKAVESITVQ